MTVTACVDCESFEYVPRFTIAASGSDNVEGINVHNAGYMECAYIYAAICAELGV